VIENTFTAELTTGQMTLLTSHNTPWVVHKRRDTTFVYIFANY